MADWAGLNHELLIEIAERTDSVESFACFSGVCRTWLAASKKGRLRQKVFEGPKLMLADENEHKKVSSSGIREFASFALGNKIHKIFLPETSNKRCLSCKDWLFIIEEDENCTSLLHPLSRVQICLPKLDTFPYYQEAMVSCPNLISKVVLSANPNTTSDFVVMVTCYDVISQLGFCKPGDSSWIAMDRLERNTFADITYFNNCLYGVTVNGLVYRCDVHGPNPTQLHPVIQQPLVSYHVMYIAGFSNKLFFITRDVVDIVKRGDSYITREFGDNRSAEGDSYRTKQFFIWEVKIEDGTLVKVENLENKSLFLGYNSSVFIESSRHNNIKPNCVYFSDDNIASYTYGEYSSGGGHDTGVYQLSDGSIEFFFDIDETVRSILTPPICGLHQAFDATITLPSYCF